MTPDSYKGITKAFQKAYKHSKVTRNAINEELDKILEEVRKAPAWSNGKDFFVDVEIVKNIIKKHKQNLEDNGMYYLTTTAKRRGAKRHIVDKSADINALRRLAQNINEKYIVEIYSGSWQLIERIGG